ncbi:ABC transporter substrate-binding protein [Candidatus Galacturonibacter soehngenii]|uniref:ABC transporter substrate-binding protein n=1 Tax=Candidatus Galacturonatibacter soehngenii TaxID=2307010 RepID=A0A7V7QLQ2_9FIRM|nr:MqnA/MqnD/SBP family protein [Candidatus Galacturonibacter soehngenii]KAB1439465.1 ABC transporter substrate-binding protein [Candidatus Galacturonibacter soehngenii]
MEQKKSISSWRKIGCVFIVVCLFALYGCGKDTKESATVRVGSLKGPTSIGLMRMMEQAESNKLTNDYTFTMETSADTLLPLMIKGELDIALVPGNVASILYQKTQGKVSVLDINTLGVLYMVSSDQTVDSLLSLKGKTVYLTGKGTTPDYVLQYLLSQAGIKEEVTLEYKSEPTEVAAILEKEENAIGLLPQPFVTATLAKNDKLSMVIDMNEEWNKIQGDKGSLLVTGVTVVRNEFLQNNEKAVLNFMKDHQESAKYVNENPKDASLLVEKSGIIEKAAIAEAAIPFCNITYIDGIEAKTALEGYLQVLFDQNAESVGGVLPNEEFYYIPNEK